MSQPKRDWSVVFHLQPYAAGPLTNWFRLLRDNDPIALKYAHKALYVTVMSALTAPLRAVESVFHGRAIANQSFDAPPVFILGHWRTGTTNLHNLMAQDPAMGFVSTYLAAVPCIAVHGEWLIRPLVARFLPKTRPQDNMSMELDLPQEDEIAMPMLTRCSFYNAFFFPNSFRRYFDRYALFDGIAPEELDEWRRVYTSLLKKAAHLCGGRRLVLKNPVNTSRIRHLLDLFPDAKFVHIYRNPYDVFASTRNLYARMLCLSTLQRYDEKGLEAYVFEFYEKMMRRYLEEKDLIPAGNLVEVRYEDFVKAPMAGLEEIYERLALPGFEEARPHFEAYAASQSGYRKNTYSLPAETIEQIGERWRFAVETWGYDVPDGLRVAPTA